MDKKQRVELIRKGNEYFNSGNITSAEKIFVACKYNDGLTRVADYFFYDKKMPLVALKYYKMVNRKDKVDEIFQRMMYALGRWVKDEKSEPEIDGSTEIEVPVHPKLKILAEEIIRDNEENDK